MIKIIESHILVGDIYEQSSKIYKLNDSHYKNLEEIKEQYQRSLARDGIWALYLSKMLEKVKLKSRVGIFAAFLPGPFLYDTITQNYKMNFDHQFNSFKKSSPPKQVFKQNSALRATHSSMYFKNQSIQMSFVCPIWGGLNAIECAEVYLADKSIDQAIILVGFNIEDPQQVAYYKQHTNELHETLVCLLIEKDNQSFSKKIKNKNLTLKFGNCSALLNENGELIKGL